MFEEENKIITGLKVASVIEQDDGSAKVIFDMTEEFKEEYMKTFQLQEWNDKHFEENMLMSLTDMAKNYENRRVQDPDFLWSLPKDINE